MYLKKQVDLEIIMKEREDKWVTVIPIINGKHNPSFECIGISAALKLLEKRYGLEDVTLDDFKVSVEKTDFARTDEAV